VTCGSDGTVKVFDVAAKQEDTRFQLGGTANVAAVSANGEVIAAGFTNGAVTLCKTSTPDEATVVPAADPVDWMALSPDGKFMAMAGTNSVRLAGS
jgi:WD40 repeat protein